MLSRVDRHSAKKTHKGTRKPTTNGNVFGVTENKIQSILQGEEDPSQTEMSMDMGFI